jgi:general stress protein 26
MKRSGPFLLPPALPAGGMVLLLKLFVKMNYMLNQSNLQFLQEKIQELRSALFFSQHTSLLRIPTTIVSISKVDELGQVWFFVSKPQQALHEFDREFPVKLEFFRKGKQFFLHIAGKAFIVTDPEEINSLLHDDIKEQMTSHMVLIKVKMMKVEYFDNSVSNHAGWWHEARTHLQSWLFNTRPGYKPYHLEAPAAMLSYTGAKVPMA